MARRTSPTPPTDTLPEPQSRLNRDGPAPGDLQSGTLLNLLEQGLSVQDAAATLNLPLPDVRRQLQVLLAQRAGALREAGRSAHVLPLLEQGMDVPEVSRTLDLTEKAVLRVLRHVLSLPPDHPVRQRWPGLPAAPGGSPKARKTERTHARAQHRDRIVAQVEAGRSVQEVAQHEGVSVDTVRRYLRAARERHAHLCARSSPQTAANGPVLPPGDPALP